MDLKKFIFLLFENVYQMYYNNGEVFIMDKNTKNDMIHIRIDSETKRESEAIFKELGITLSYAVSLFLKQVILHDGFPFDVRIPKVIKSEHEILADTINSIDGHGKSSKEAQKIYRLFINGDIDYETAVFALQRRFKNK